MALTITKMRAKVVKGKGKGRRDDEDVVMTRIEKKQCFDSDASGGWRHTPPP